MTPTRLLVLLGAASLLSLTACRTIRDEIGVEGGTTAHAFLRTSDGAEIDLWRWAPRDATAPKVLVIPELGFGHTLVARLCERLRDSGYDVATLDGRETTGKAGKFAGLDGWTIDVARAYAAHGPRPLVVALGIGGSTAWRVAEDARGIVAVNVPVRWSVANQALAFGLSANGYDPRRWSRSALGPLLLGAGHATSPDAEDELRRHAQPLSTDMQRDVASALRSLSTSTLPTVPIRVLVGVKDNLVASEDALPDGGRAFAHVRRLAHAEGFQRDSGHLEWLVDAASLREVTAAIVAELEATP